MLSVFDFLGWEARGIEAHARLFWRCTVWYGKFGNRFIQAGDTVQIVQGSRRKDATVLRSWGSGDPVRRHVDVEVEDCSTLCAKARTASQEKEVPVERRSPARAIPEKKVDAKLLWSCCAPDEKLCQSSICTVWGCVVFTCSVGADVATPPGAYWSRALAQRSPLTAPVLPKSGATGCVGCWRNTGSTKKQ